MSGPAYLVAKSGSGTSHPGESKIEREEAFPGFGLRLANCAASARWKFVSGTREYRQVTYTCVSPMRAKPPFLARVRS
jgi:hypothetical protein